MYIKGGLLVSVGFVAGVTATQLPSAIASSPAPTAELSARKFDVFIDEVKQNFVFGDRFSETYHKEVTLSDGTKRTINLTPMVHEGMQVVEFRDTGGHTYMGLNGTTTNGKLMVHVVDVAASHAALKEQGWKLPE
jgi:hypothetical protein